jgi:hypothetical protein
MSWFNRGKETKAEKIVRQNKTLTAKEGSILFNAMLSTLADELVKDCKICSETGSKTELKVYEHIASVFRKRAKI